ncbi:MAG: branched-chain amino acid ABC transporter substrate-binding protein [Betaproteobacteria bacterium RIFCSPLOWO2_12_FULL_64_23]|nr:MAG: branched-chain amino acid ABC transporter substrate-binding protein [Betaproteobacteria bacterium RIFCSPLOWO2_12_FULL_64_23]
MSKLSRSLLALFLAAAATSALADITVGVILSATGPAASLGIPEKNTVTLMPTTIGGQKVNYIVLDDATDPTAASKNARKLVSEDKVDVIIGATTTPTSTAVLEVAAETKTPQIAMAPFAPAADKAAWVFQTPQDFSIMAGAIVGHMVANGVKTVAFIGYSDGYGELWLRVMNGITGAKGITMVATERFNRTDTSVTGQILKILSTNPDAVLVVGSGTPAALPQVTLVERGYKGRIYQTHGVANKDFLRVGGKNLEGTVLPIGPILVAEQLPDSNASKKVALNYIKLYEAAYGADSRNSFGAHAWDAGLLLQQAIPEALKKAKPGTHEFRAALRDALENVKEMPANHGVFSYSASDHKGLDSRAVVMVHIENGTWKVLR